MLGSLPSAAIAPVVIYSPVGNILKLNPVNVNVNVIEGDRRKNTTRFCDRYSATQEYNNLKQKGFDHKYLDALFDLYILRYYLIYTDNNVMYVLLSNLYYHSKLCC